MSGPLRRFSHRGLVDQVRPLTYLKSAEFVGLGLFSITVPLLMGPELFGQFVLILAVQGIIQRVVTMGGGHLVFGRFVPEYEARGDHRATEVMFMHMLQFRLLAISFGAPIYYFSLRGVLPKASPEALGASVAAFVVASVAAPMFVVFYGFNRLALASLWECCNRILLVITLFVLGAWASLERAALALLVLQLVALSVGVILTWRLFTLDRAIFDFKWMRRHVGFGVGAFASSYLMGLPRIAGETVLALLGFGDAQVGFFGLANSASGAFARLFGKLPKLLVPSVGALESAGDLSSGERGFAATIKFSSFLIVLMVIGASWVGDPLVRWVWGDGFAPVAPHLVLLTISLLPVPWIRTAMALAVVRDRIAASYRIGVVGVVAVGIAVPVLRPWFGPLSVSMAIATAAAVSGWVAARFLKETEIPRRTRALEHTAAVLIVLVCLAIGRGNPWWTGAGLAGYLLVVRIRGVFTLEELRSVGCVLWSGWRSGRTGKGPLDRGSQHV